MTVHHVTPYPFQFQTSSLLTSKHFFQCQFGEMADTSRRYTQADSYLYSYHFPAWQCISIARRNTILIALGNFQLSLCFIQNLLRRLKDLSQRRNILKNLTIFFFQVRRSKCAVIFLTHSHPLLIFCVFVPQKTIISIFASI